MLQKTSDTIVDLSKDEMKLCPYCKSLIKARDFLFHQQNCKVKEDILKDDTKDKST